MRNLKQRPHLYESFKSDRFPLCERTDLTDEQRSKLFNVDKLYAMATGSLSDSIWAPGNESKLDDRKRSAGPPISRNQAEGDLTNLSATATPFKSKFAMNTAAVPPVKSSFMASGTPLSNQQSQNQWMTPTTIASTVPDRQKQANRGDNSPCMPPHLRGIENNRQTSLPPHLRAVAPNTQFGLSRQPNNSTDIRNSPASFSTPQTPHKGASVGDPIWHISPKSEVKQSPGSYASAASMAVNHSYQSEVPHQVQPISAPQFDLQPTSPVTAQTPQTQPTVDKNRLQHSSVDNTDVFLAFIEQRSRDSPANGKRYVAIATSPQPESRDKDVNHEPQASATATNSLKENTPLRTAPNAVTYTPTSLIPVMQSGMMAQTGTPIEKNGNLHTERSFSVPRTSHEAASFTVAAGNLRQATTLVGGMAFQNHGNSNSATGQVSHGWEEDPILLNAKDIQKALLSEIMVRNPLDRGASPLTEESLMKNGGWAPRVHSEDSFCGKVSDTGVEMKKENVRASQGKDAADELLHRDHSYYPHIPEWDSARWALDASFIPTYIQEDWLPLVPHGRAVTVDTSTESFRQGKLPVSDRVLGEEVIQPDCIPDIANSENEQKRLRQTSEIDALILTKKRKKRYKNAELQVAESEARYRDIQAQEPAPHPYAPAIPIYLRPTTHTDGPGVRAIYNYYIKNSIIPEDQAEILEEDVEGMIKLCKQETLPFIVAIKGNVPVIPPQGHCGKSSKPLLPQFETIVGFGFAQTYGYGMGGRRDGRSRVTAELQFYVHHEYTRKGVGRSLLDRLTQTLSPSYAGKDGYDWLNPSNDLIYDGSRLWHQLVIQLPVEIKEEDDTTLPWITQFLARYWFDKEARLKRFARSSVNASQAKFLDVVVFAKTASAQMEHPPFL